MSQKTLGQCNDICAQLFEAPATVNAPITKRDPYLNLLKVFGERFARANGAWRLGLSFNFRHVFISLLDLSDLMFFIEAADEVQIVPVIQGLRNLPRMLRFQRAPHT
jgi:hypothetical protein